MTPDERAALDRQARVAATPEVRAERREPLPGQGELPMHAEPATESEWAARLAAAEKRRDAALAKIDHGRRAHLIRREVRGLNMRREEKDELESLQSACDEALRECDDLRLAYSRWQSRRIAATPGLGELPMRSGWDLVTSRCLTEEQARKADELARAEKRESRGKAKGRDKGKGE